MTLELSPPYRRSSMTPADQAARALAFASIALGVAEMAFPGLIAKSLGMKDKQGLLRAYGAREIAAGIGALQPNAAPAIWARAAGDVVDLVTLAVARDPESGRRGATSQAMVTIAVITVIDIAVAAMLMKQKARGGPVRDYSDRSGFPNGVAAARGAAANRTPTDMRVAPEQRQWKDDHSQAQRSAK